METRPKWMRSYQVMDVLNSPSQIFQDCTPKTESLVREYDFEPRRILELLSERTSQTSPEKFLIDMDNLIHFRLYADMYSSNTVANDEEWYKELIKLETTYKVDKVARHPDSVTLSRLCLTFPHYSLIHRQKLINPKGNTVSHVEQFFFPEFGSLIPTRHSWIRKDVKEKIVLLHIWYLCNQQLLNPNHSGPEISEYTSYLLLRKRIERGILTNERRLRFLMNQNVIQIDGDLTPQTKRSFETLYTRCPEFCENGVKIWNFIA